MSNTLDFLTPLNMSELLLSIEYTFVAFKIKMLTFKHIEILKNEFRIRKMETNA